MKKLLPLLLALVVTAALAQSSTGINGGGPNTLPGAGPANEVLATPAGAAGSVSLRALTSADLPALTSTQVVTSFTGTCNSSTFLNGGGSCTAPIQTALKPTDETRNAGALNPDANITFSLAAGSYAFNCYLVWINNASGGTLSSGFGNNGTSTNTYWTAFFVQLSGNPSSVSYTTGSNGNNPAGNSSTLNNVLTGEMVSGTIKYASSNTFGLNWTEATVGDAATLKAGSWCTVTKTG